MKLDNLIHKNKKGQSVFGFLKNGIIALGFAFLLLGAFSVANDKFAGQVDSGSNSDLVLGNVSLGYQEAGEGSPTIWGMFVVAIIIGLVFTIAKQSKGKGSN